jgi:hypothetical protein
MGEILHEGKIKDLSVTVDQVIGRTGGRGKIPGTSYLLITLDGNAQKFLAITEEGSDDVQLIEAKDAEEAGELMIDHIGEKLGVPPEATVKNP